MLVNRVKGWSGIALEHEPKNNQFRKSPNIFGFDSEKVMTFLELRQKCYTFVGKIGCLYDKQKH